MVVWFATIGLLGLLSLWQTPSILWALSPHHGTLFFVNHGWHSITVLGSVVLAVTGGEALYADMGHFGRKPIRMSWLGLRNPASITSPYAPFDCLLGHHRSGSECVVGQASGSRGARDSRRQNLPGGKSLWI